MKTKIDIFRFFGIGKDVKSENLTSPYRENIAQQV